jgi:hypothetical protein
MTDPLNPAAKTRWHIWLANITQVTITGSNSAQTVRPLLRRNSQSAYAKPPPGPVPPPRSGSRCTGALYASEHTATESCEGHANVPGDDRREAAVVVRRSPFNAPPPPPPPPHLRGQNGYPRRVPGHCGGPPAARAGPQQRHRLAYTPATSHPPSRRDK